MKNLLSKEHYCYKIHTLLMKSSAYPHPSIDNPLYELPRPSILQENPKPPSMFLSKFQPLPI